MEGQSIEWKREWNEKALKEICAFANTNGGTLLIGISDDGSIAGVNRPKEVMKKISDTVSNKLSIYPAIELESSGIIKITVSKSARPIDLDNKYYVRVGNTTQIAKGEEYETLIARRLNLSWADMPLEGLDVNCLDKAAIDYFRKKAIARGVLKESSVNIPDIELLRKLKVVTGEGAITRTAVLLFHSNPENIIQGSSVKVGLFDGAEILYQDYVGGPLISMPDRLCDLIQTKYSKRRISYSGLNLVETAPYPAESLRECIMNAVMHNNYGSGNPIQIRIWEDMMRIADHGGLPSGWTESYLLGAHESVPTNPTLANIYFYAGFVEGWGRGIATILEGYDEYPDKKPEFRTTSTSFTVTLRNVNFSSHSGVTNNLRTSAILSFLDCGEGRNSREIAEYLNLDGHTSVVTRYITPLIELGFVERTISLSPTSRNQRYRTTAEGRKSICHKQLE